ncbi:MAG: MFS transporter [Myxococcales bacterium]|nr:MFS transporter [Myxococcales bacterium]
MSEPSAPQPGSASTEAYADSVSRPSWRRAFGLLWLGQGVSHLGDALFLTAIVFIAIDVTGSKSAAGLLSGLKYAPAILFGLFAGALVDRYDRRRVMLWADLLRAVAVGCIPLLHATGRLGGASLGLAVFALAAGTTLFNPAIKALLPEFTPTRHLTRAISAFQLAEYTAFVLGPYIASLIAPRLGNVHLLTVDAATFLFSAACIAALPRAAGTRKGADCAGPTIGAEPALPPLHRVVRGAFSGARDVMRLPPIGALVFIGTLNNLVIMGLAHVGVPVLVYESLGLDLAAYGSTLKFFFLGMATASMLLWSLGRRMPKGLTLSIGILLDGLTFVPFAFCKTLGHVQAAQFVHGLVIPLIIIPRTVLVQRVVPSRLHGRAFALINVTVFGMTAISNPVVGFLTEWYEPRTLFLWLGLLGALPGFLGLLLPTLRRAR